MFDRYEIENIILGMAELVYENRALRKENNDLRLKVAKNDAFLSNLVGNSEAKKRYEVLCDIENRNTRVRLCDSAGCITSEDYIHDWEDELERRMAEKN